MHSYPQYGRELYEIKSSVIQLLLYSNELTKVDAYEHLDEFLDVCSTVKIQNFSDDALRLTPSLFPLRIKPNIS